ncbi:MAG: glycosyltransferase [Chthoniobacteraceae bacterium]
MSAPLFSIVINNYNYGKFLAETIESCLAQTYQPLEVIVVDDGSTDNSREIIASFGDRVIPVLKPNGGQGSAFNAGYQAAKGDYVLFLDSDDLLRADAAALFAAGFRNPQISKVQARLRLIDGDSQFMGIEDPGRRTRRGGLETARA